MRIALGQQPHQSGQMSNAIDRMRGRKVTGRPQAQALDRIVAEMLVESCPPGSTHAVARLQDRPEPRAKTSAHKAEMAPMAMRHQFEDGIRLPVPLDPEHYAVIGPLHILLVISGRTFRRGLAIHTPRIRENHGDKGYGFRAARCAPE